MAEERPVRASGRGLAALIGDVGDEVRRRRARARPAPRAGRVPAAEPAQPAQELRRGRPRRARRLDPREGHHPADPGAHDARAWPTSTRSSPASGAGAPRSGPGCTRCRCSSSRWATAKRSSSRSSRTCSAPTSTRSRRRCGYEQLIDEFSYTQDDLGRIIGKSRSHVANTLRLLKLPDGVKALVSEGRADAPATRGRCCPLTIPRRRRGGSSSGA